MDVSDSRPLLRMLNPHLVCPLCSGYLIDATTVRDCLHSFCLSCILPVVHSTRRCPMCQHSLTADNPLDDLIRDDSLQKLVYKIVPGLLKQEKQRRDNFVDVCKTMVPGGVRTHLEDSVMDSLLTVDDYLSVMLKCCFRFPGRGSHLRSKNMLKVIRRWHLCVPATLPVGLLRKFLQLKLDIVCSRYKIDFYSGDKRLLDADTVMDAAYMQRWNQRKVLVLKFIVGCPRSVSFKLDAGENKDKASIGDNCTDAKSKSFAANGKSPASSSSNKTSPPGKESVSTKLNASSLSEKKSEKNGNSDDDVRMLTVKMGKKTYSKVVSQNGHVTSVRQAKIAAGSALLQLKATTNGHGKSNMNNASMKSLKSTVNGKSVRVLGQLTVLKQEKH